MSSGTEYGRTFQRKEDIMKIWINGVYIGAAYCKCSRIGGSLPESGLLKRSFKKNADEQLPGVWFDIESGDHALQSSGQAMAKEITGYTNDIKSDISTGRISGFVFSSKKRSA